MTFPELSQGVQGPRSPFPPGPEREVPRRRLGVTRTSTPGLGVNSQVPSLTGAARTRVFCHSPSTGATGLLPETLKTPPKGAGATTLREVRFTLGLSHFKSLGGLWPLPLPVVKFN